MFTVKNLIPILGKTLDVGPVDAIEVSSSDRTACHEVEDRDLVFWRQHLQDCLRRNCPPKAEKPPVPPPDMMTEADKRTIAHRKQQNLGDWENNREHRGDCSENRGLSPHSQRPGLPALGDLPLGVERSTHQVKGGINGTHTDDADNETRPCE
jgi:hypothetical protein